MKAVIFNSSVKDPKYSNTYAWCKVLANRLEKRNIQSEIVNLKEIDYEASTSDKDTLYKQFEKVYDAITVNKIAKEQLIPIHKYAETSLFPDIESRSPLIIQYMGLI